ncbi:hypothetical protein HPP92_026119 [Vanilla planifolia]|uniref:Uncharacterized protein n=1 Tax=Vanilla planifolia TaxID=51239 RepID=A0A835U9Y4_VANPL|nr:hypothetical protein HPP92_026119 [Vanilla planifolia]
MALLQAENRSAEHGGEGAKDDLLAGDGRAKIIVEAELLLRGPKQALELRPAQE